MRHGDGEDAPRGRQRAQAVAVEGDAVDRDGGDGDDGPARLQRGHAGEDARDHEREHDLRGIVTPQQRHGDADRGDDTERRQSL
jgi:hypothetical protein